MRQTRTKAGAALALCIAAAACGASAVSQADIEKGVADQLEAKIGQRPDVSCDGELPAKKGAKLRCELKADDGSTIGATVTATKVDGSDVSYTVIVDDA